MTETRSRASLVVLSATLKPDDLVERLGRADRAWSAGDPPLPNSKSRQRFNGWSIDSQLDRSAPPRDHIAEICARLPPITPSLQALTAEGAVESIRVWLHLDSPEVGVSFDQDSLAAISAVGSLEINIYG